jgi:hypothetical protein
MARGTRRFGYGSPFLNPYVRQAPLGLRKKPESLNVHVALHVQHKHFGTFCPFFD